MNWHQMLLCPDLKQFETVHDVVTVVVVGSEVPTLCFVAIVTKAVHPMNSMNWMYPVIGHLTHLDVGGTDNI